MILILKFSNQNQMILSCDFKKIESFDSDFIFKDFKNDSIFTALRTTNIKLLPLIKKILLGSKFLRFSVAPINALRRDPAYVARTRLGYLCAKKEHLPLSKIPTFLNIFQDNEIFWNCP